MLATKLAASGLDRRIAELRAARGGSVRLEEVGELVESMIGSLQGDLSPGEIMVQRELGELVDYIRQAHAEIASIHPAEIGSVHIPAATDELDAVVSATAEATDAILDAAEQLSRMAESLPAKQAEALAKITTRIYEASNFQDITGQRITKVVRTLRHIEDRVLALAHSLGEAAPAPVDASNGSAPDDEASLLNGPQLPGRANSQADIDALLESFD
ncbi:MAG: protein phosphatase CheZ [Alphaproteobacteria bacterium]|nr:protein phosphatase CheZ [Alphaproteobacteria bacterium]